MWLSCAVYYYYVVILILNFTGSLNPPGVSTRPVFDMDGVSVTLDWMPEEGVSYSVSADEGVNISYTQRSTITLTVPYNTPTNVTIIASSCGGNSETAITSLELAYGNSSNNYDWGTCSLFYSCASQVNVRIPYCQLLVIL